MPDPAKVTPLAVVEMLYVPAVVTLAVMVWVTPDTAFPLVIAPAQAVEQSYAETTAVPLVERIIVVAALTPLPPTLLFLAVTPALMLVLSDT